MPLKIGAEGASHAEFIKATGGLRGNFPCSVYLALRELTLVRMPAIIE